MSSDKKDIKDYKKAERDYSKNEKAIKELYRKLPSLMQESIDVDHNTDYSTETKKAFHETIDKRIKFYHEEIERLGDAQDGLEEKIYVKPTHETADASFHENKSKEFFDKSASSKTLESKLANEELAEYHEKQKRQIEALDAPLEEKVLVNKRASFHAENAAQIAEAMNETKDPKTLESLTKRFEYEMAQAHQRGTPGLSSDVEKHDKVMQGKRANVTAYEKATGGMNRAVGLWMAYKSWESLFTKTPELDKKGHQVYDKDGKAVLTTNFVANFKNIFKDTPPADTVWAIGDSAKSITFGVIGAKSVIDEVKSVKTGMKSLQGKVGPKSIVQGFKDVVGAPKKLGGLITDGWDRLRHGPSLEQEAKTAKKQALKAQKIAEKKEAERLAKELEEKAAKELEEKFIKNAAEKAAEEAAVKNLSKAATDKLVQETEAAATKRFEKTLAEKGLKGAEKLAIKEGVQIGEKMGAKGMTKLVGRRIPFVGIGFCAYDMIKGLAQRNEDGGNGFKKGAANMGIVLAESGATALLGSAAVAAAIPFLAIPVVGWIAGAAVIGVSIWASMKADDHFDKKGQEFALRERTVSQNSTADNFQNVRAAEQARQSMMNNVPLKNNGSDYESNDPLDRMMEDRFKKEFEEEETADAAPPALVKTNQIERS